MDLNKLKRLRSISYSIAKCCATCAHSKFTHRTNDFGNCMKFSYDHVKHESTLNLSINRYGICHSYEQKKLDDEFGQFMAKVDGE